MAEALRILVLEDRPADAELIQFELQEAGLFFVAKVVMTKNDFSYALQEFSPDLILSDYDLPQYNGALALAEAKRQCPDTPFILVTGAISEDRAVDILTSGAKDYVMKNRLNRLVPAVKRALGEAEELRARKKAEAALRKAHRNLETRIKKRTETLRAEIAERRQVEEELNRSERRYKLLYETMLQGVVYQDAKGRVISMNPAAERILGKNPAEFLEHTSGSMEYPTLRADGSVLPAPDHPSMVALRRGQELRDMVMGVYNPREKEYRWINVRAVPLFLPGKDKPDQVYIIFDDITERRQAERRQFLAAEIMQIINESPALSDTITLILTAIKRETGCDAVGIRLQSGDDFPYFVQNGFLHDFLLTENALAVRDQDGEICRDKNGKISLECTCGLVISGRTDPTNPLFTQGGSFWINDSLPLLDLPADQEARLNPRNRCIHEGFRSIALIPIRANQEIVGLLQLNDRKKGCFSLDMIHFFEGLGASIGIALVRKQAEGAIKERTLQLEAANRELESFSYSISHDLREPLRAIDGFSQILSKNLAGKIDEASQQKLKVIREKVQKLGLLINGVLDFHRLGSRALVINIIDMGQLANEVWNELSVNYPQRNIVFKIGRLATCRGDNRLIRQVFTNLISNAVKFTKDRQTAIIQVGGNERANEYVCHVQDNGTGFDMQYYDKLFGIFQRLHSGEEYEGTGVGLSIVKKIVERHGGSVWAESKVDVGSTFYFSLPKG